MFWEKSLQRGIVKQENTERDGEEVEKSIISCQDDENHKDRDRSRGDHAHAPREEYEKRNDKLDDEHDRNRCGVKPTGHLVHVPRDRRGERLRLVMKRERGKISP